MAGRKNPFLLFSTFLFAAFLFLAAASPAPAATITVTNTNDSGAGSLRQAILDSNDPTSNVIDFAQGVTGTITLSSGYLEIEQNLTIIGPADGGLSVSGNGQVGVFVIQGGTVILSNLTIQNGSVSTGGGGIHNSGDLTLNNCTISGNQDSSLYEGGGGIHNAYGADLTLNNCTITGNTAGAMGGGIYNAGGLTLSNCTVKGNSVSGGNGQGGGIYSNSLDGLVLTNCTISGNSVPGDTGNGGGIYVGDNALGIVLTNCTVTQNTAYDGAGYYGFASISDITMKNTILSGNTGLSDITVTSSTFVSESYNLVGTVRSESGASSFNGPGDIPSSSPGLAALADNGGPTWTHALLSTSPALDAGTGDGVPSTDQRGEARTLDGDNDGVSVTDIGAYEYVPTPVSGCDSDVPPSAHGQHVIGSTADGRIFITLTGSDQDDLNLTYKVVEGPKSGALTGTPPDLVYTWGGGPAVTDGFTFRVNDGCHDSATATVNIEMLNPVGVPFNAPPVPHPLVLNGGYSGNYTAMNITLSGSDHDSDPLTYEVVEPPRNGTLTGTPPNLTFNTTLTSGTDVFYYRVVDNRTDVPRYSVAVPVYIHIGEGFQVTGLPPVADAGPYMNTTSPAVLDGSNSYDPAGRTLSYQWKSDGGTLNVTNSEKVQFTAFPGDYTCTLTVQNLDGLKATDSATVSIYKEVASPAYDALSLTLLAVFCAFIGLVYVRRGARKRG